MIYTQSYSLEVKVQYTRSDFFVGTIFKSYAKGRAIQNLINIEQDDKVKAYVVVKDIKDEEYTSNNYIIMCTKKGIIKKKSE